MVDLLVEKHCISCDEFLFISDESNVDTYCCYDCRSTLGVNDKEVLVLDNEGYIINDFT